MACDDDYKLHEAFSNKKEDEEKNVESTTSEEEWIRLCALKMAIWSRTKEIRTIDGLDICESDVLWMLCAKHRPPRRGDAEESKLKLKDCDRVKLVKDWIHEGDVPFSRMTVQEFSDTLEALEWHVLSDVWFTNRDDEIWYEQVTSMVEALRSRAFFLATHALNEHIMNVEEYRREYDSFRRSNDEEGKEDGGEYDSDEEIRVRKSKRVKRRLPERIYKKYVVSPSFVFDVNTLFTSLDRAMFSYETSVPRPKKYEKKKK